MGKTRLEAFSDGVLAIIITIMVLELKIPQGDSWQVLLEMRHTAASYALSFVFIGIYWGNHHHLLHTVKRVSGGIIWANLNLLFWLSWVPFGTTRMGENHFTTHTVAFYATLLAFCGISYTILQITIQKNHRFDEKMQIAMQKTTKKGIFSMFSYLSAIPLAFLHPIVSCAIFVIVAVVWLIPERNIEQALNID